MGENDDPKKTPPSNPSEAGGEAPSQPGVVISPEPAAQEARQRKDPPVLDGDAEILSEKIKAKSESKPADAPKPATAAAPARSASFIPVALIAGVVGALVVGAVGHFLGYGRVSFETQDQAIAALDTKLTALGGETETARKDLQDTVLKLTVRLNEAEAELARQAQSPENIAAIRTELDGLAARTTTLTTALEQLTTSNTDAKARIANLEATLTAINMAMAALGPRLDETIVRVTALEERAKNPDAAGRAALGLALANLARASESGGPFKTELDVIASFLPDEPELASLAPVAARGAPSFALLKEQFPGMVQAVFDAERRGDESSLWSKLWGNAKSIITIRRTGEISGTGTEAVIARMEERLKGGDLPAALEQGRLLEGAAAEAAKAWLDGAQARIDLDRLVRNLSARVASRLAKD